MAIAEGIAAAKLALTALKEARNLLKFPQVEIEKVRDKLIELEDLIHSARSSLADARDENDELKRQLDDREALKVLALDMDFQLDGAFYIKLSEKSRGVIPYCPTCWKHNKDVHMKPGYGPGAYVCPIHGTEYCTQANLDWRAREALALRDAEAIRQANDSPY